MTKGIQLFTGKEDCCGCTACESICPKIAIEMKADKEGFLYPEIDINKCIECTLCKKVCSFQNGYDTDTNLESPHVYAVKHKDDKIRQKSRSGGVFVSISDKVLECNGVVYGVGYRDDFIIAHKRIEDIEKINEFQGSKYVQSNLDSIFKKIKLDLLNDKYVLFSGTPCQVAGLNSYLGNRIDKEKLLTVDLVCHGVPSPLIWKEYINFIEKKYKGSLQEFNFRNKKYGWNSHFETFVINNKENKSNIYTKLFYSNNILRPSCHNCKYTNFDRVADVTIADFWGIDKCLPDFDDNKGVSLVLVNTTKGINIFNEIKENLDYRESNVEDCVQYNLKDPTPISTGRDVFWEKYHKYGFNYIVKNYTQDRLKNKLKNRIKILIKKIV